MNDITDYSVPALDKALDILELLANQSGGLSQTEIAEATGRSVGQIFRVLATLERRGYAARDRQSGLYVLSMGVFDLAHRHPPFRGLVQVATGPMRDLSDRVHQSCNLSVIDAERVRVIAQVESPSDFGYRVRVGAQFHLDATATGLVLVAGATPEARESLAGVFAEENLEDIRRDGFLSRPDSLQEGIIDLAVPIRGPGGATIAALTVPYVATSFSTVPSADVLTAAVATAAIIAARLRGNVEDQSR